MLPFLQRCQLVVRPSAIRGYGVFADQEILTGEIIEQCYVLYCRQNLLEFENYLFHCPKSDILALGYGSIYNHSDEPNANYTYDAQHNIVAFKSNRYIKKGEEIFISYGTKWFQSREETQKERWRIRLQRHLSKTTRFVLLSSFLVTLIFCLKQLKF